MAENIDFKSVTLLTSLWDLKHILRSRQNRSKNKLVGENAVTQVHGSCALSVMGS